MSFEKEVIDLIKYIQFLERAGVTGDSSWALMSEEERQTLIEKEIQKLREMGPGVVPILVNQLEKSYEYYENPKSTIINILVAIGDSQAIDPIIATLKDEDLITYAAEALHELPARRAILPLLDALVAYHRDRHGSDPYVEISKALIRCGVAVATVTERLRKEPESERRARLTKLLVDIPGIERKGIHSRPNPHMQLTSLSLVPMPRLKPAYVPVCEASLADPARRLMRNVSREEFHHQSIWWSTRIRQ